MPDDKTFETESDLIRPRHYVVPPSPWIKIQKDTLRKFLDNAGRSLQRRSEWWAPLGVVVTLLATIATADFHDVLGIAACTVQAFFGLVLLISLAALIVTLNRRRNALTIDELVDNLEASGRATDADQESH